ncbi:protein FAR1-RELATED SEQUENCE 5-like [Cornus florida]|uniref:protein FAR1-RELATED SEQUENCE 5-like n=1 Tax=Cornus florida TaxID=4283 RepID=UPI0028A1B852|nr:protein FAR1-RELATED SEQUENCE 5-like [Cornus florida]
MLTRTGCKARAIFNAENGIWELFKFISEHNHVFAKPEERHLLRSGRKITSTNANILSSMSKVGIRVTKAYPYLSKEVGGVQHVGFTERDCHNFLQSEKSKSIEAGDAQSVINYFKCKQSENPIFFYTVQVDDQNRMTSFFWRDGSSKLNYQYFGDVVIFDTTYRTNKYNMICAPFVGVNHHWKNVLFDCAFLLNETTASFVWLFEAFLEAMGNKAPSTIFTDQDSAMANAIRKVLPNTRHRLCTWHIMKNAAQIISTLFANPRFKDKLTKLFYGCETEEEFESIWGKINEEHDIVGNKWLSKLYDICEKWCQVFSRDTFSANILSTQRS